MASVFQGEFTEEMFSGLTSYFGKVSNGFCKGSGLIERFLVPILNQVTCFNLSCPRVRVAPAPPSDVLLFNAKPDFFFGFYTFARGFCFSLSTFGPISSSPSLGLVCIFVSLYIEMRWAFPIWLEPQTNGSYRSLEDLYDVKRRVRERLCGKIFGVSYFGH